MFCSQCGHENSDIAKFCTKCGNQIELINHKGFPIHVEPESQKGFSLWEYFIGCFKKYFEFKGRARRKEYWGFALFNCIFLVALSLLDVIVFGTGYDSYGLFYVIYALGSFFPSIAVFIRRLHDVDKSGWNWLWCITIIGILYVFYLLVKESDPAENKYGRNPKYGAA